METMEQPTTLKELMEMPASRLIPFRSEMVDTFCDVTVAQFAVAYPEDCESKFVRELCQMSGILPDHRIRISVWFALFWITLPKHPLWINATRSWRDYIKEYLVNQMTSSKM